MPNPTASPGAAEHDKLLGTYLNDHLAGSSAGVDLFARVAGHAEGSDADELATLAREVSEDKDALLEVMRVVGVRPRQAAVLVGRIAEKVGRLKPNGHLVRRSPLTPLVEIEMLRTAVAGKTAGWQALLALAADDQRLPVKLLERLLQRANDQATQLVSLHQHTARRQLGDPPTD
ncbi:MAG: hypothetical protein ACR2KG_02285 [Nocardioidaceae bacterium]